MFPQTGCLGRWREEWCPSPSLPASLSKCFSAVAEGGESGEETSVLDPDLALSPASIKQYLQQGPALGASQLLGGSLHSLGLRHVGIPIPPRGRNQEACVLVVIPWAWRKERRGKGVQEGVLAGLEPRQLLFSWGWSVGGGAERNKQGFQMSSSPLKSHSLKHICVSRAVHSENRLSQLLFLVLCVGYLYGSFFPPFKSDPLVYKGPVQTELYPESCSQHFLIS